MKAVVNTQFGNMAVRLEHANVSYFSEITKYGSLDLSDINKMLQKFDEVVDFRGYFTMPEDENRNDYDKQVTFNGKAYRNIAVSIRKAHGEKSDYRGYYISVSGADINGWASRK